MTKQIKKTLREKLEEITYNAGTMNEAMWFDTYGTQSLTDVTLTLISKEIKKNRPKEENWKDNDYAGMAELIDGGENLKMVTEARNHALKEYDESVDKVLKQIW